MMELPGFFSMSGSAARVMRKTPSTLLCSMASQSSSLPSRRVQAVGAAGVVDQHIEHRAG